MAYGRTLQKIFDDDEAMAEQSTTNAPTDEAGLLLLLDCVDVTIKSTMDELRAVRMAVTNNMSSDAKAIARATGQRLEGEIGKAQTLSFEVKKLLAHIQTQRVASNIAKSRGLHLAGLYAEQADLRKCADSPAAQTLNEPTQRHLRQSLFRVGIEIAQASRRSRRRP